MIRMLCYQRCGDFVGKSKHMIKLPKKWVRNEDGAVAIEFALVAAPFFITIIGIMEFCLFFATGMALEGAANDAARVIRTGEAQKSGDPVTVFQDRLCETISVIVNCDGVNYEVIEIPDDSFYSIADYEPEFDEDGNLVSQGFAPGGVESTVLVRLAYRYNFKTPLIKHILSGGDVETPYTHMATVVLRNEPYAFE